MILAWIAYASACAAMCAVVGACVDALLRHRVQRRRLVWVATMTASLLLSVSVPVVAAFSPQRALTHPQTRASKVGTPLLNAPATDWNRLTLVLWAGSSLLLAGALHWSHRRMRRRMRAFREASVDGEPLLVSDDFGPALVGWWHPRIVLPAWALSLAQLERRFVVSHELEHRRASDPALAMVALTAVVLFPWNLALWWQLSRLLLAIEFDCDARVVRRLGADPFTYGKMLVAAQRFARHARGPALAMAPLRSALGKRVHALVATNTPSRIRSFGAVALAGGAFAVFAVMPIPVLPLRSVTAPSNPPPAAQSNRPVAAGFMTAVPPRLVGGAGGGVNTPRDPMAAFRARYPDDTIVRSGFMGAEVRPRAALAASQSKH